MWFIKGGLMYLKYLVLCLGVLFLSGGCTKSPESTVQSFYRSLEKGNIAEAKKCLSAQMTASGDELISAVLSAAMSKINSCGNIKDLSVKMSGDGAVRTGAVAMTFSGKCPPSTDKTQLIMEDGKWKINFPSEPTARYGNPYEAIK
jgi:hypothetical protein